MSARFWRNVILIGLAHVVAIVGLVRWSRAVPKEDATRIMWVDGNEATAALASAARPSPQMASTPVEPVPEETPPADNEETKPEPAVLKSEIELPVATPTPS